MGVQAVLMIVNIFLQQMRFLESNIIALALFITLLMFAANRFFSTYEYTPCQIFITVDF